MNCPEIDREFVRNAVNEYLENGGKITVIRKAEHNAGRRPYDAADNADFILCSPHSQPKYHKVI